MDWIESKSLGMRACRRSRVVLQDYLYGRGGMRRVWRRVASEDVLRVGGESTEVEPGGGGVLPGGGVPKVERCCSLVQRQRRVFNRSRRVV